MDILLLLLFFMIIFAILGEFFPSPSTQALSKSKLIVEKKGTLTVLEIRKVFRTIETLVDSSLGNAVLGKKKIEATFVSFLDLSSLLLPGGAPGLYSR